MATTEAAVAATPKAANDAGTPPVEEKPSASGGGGADLRLANEPWYHGLLPREDIKMMLRNNGDFLVRATEPVAGQARHMVLSVMWRQELDDVGIKHFVVKLVEGMYMIERYRFQHISEMIAYHLKTKDSISAANSDVILKTAITRQAWELSHNDVDLVKKLGEGAFGEVHAGKLRIRVGNQKPKYVNVAVKLAKLEILTKDQIKEIMHEARLMRNFDHPNVVKFYGVAAGQEPLMVIMELVDQGALDSYLKKNELSMDKKAEMILQAAWGLAYLHTIPVLHRDIAARNCLYGDNKVKISDFGLTRVGTVYQMDPRKRVPIRWLAPETLRSAYYSQKTDVFSYGILCWEIINNGLEPYPEMTPAQVSVQVKEGYRMPLPPDLPPHLQTMVAKCWADNVNERWSMDQCVKILQRAMPQFKQPSTTKEKTKDESKDVSEEKSQQQTTTNAGSNSKSKNSKQSKSRNASPLGKAKKSNRAMTRKRSSSS